MSATDLTISIVSGRSPELLYQCLQSLGESLDNTISTDIWLVDNASPENVGAAVSRRFPQVNVICNEKPLGFGANHNQVIARHNARYFLVLNDDVIVRPGACQRLVAAADQHLQAGFFGPRLLNPDGSLQRSAHRFPGIQLALIEALGLDRLLPAAFDTYRFWSHDSLRVVDYLTGAALMVRDEVIKDVGVFDENFFMYGEEADWCWRAGEAGWQTLFVPNAEIVHYGGQSTVGLSAEKSVEFLRGHGRLLRKHHGSAYLGAYRAVCLFKHLPRWLVSRICGTPKQATEQDIVLWSLGLLRRPGLAETVMKQQS